MVYKYKTQKNYHIAFQSIFFDYKLLLKIQTKFLLHSISNVYKSNVWVERELKEFNDIFYFNMNDSRKLLLNYNYNKVLPYSQYNNIIEDIQL